MSSRMDKYKNQPVSKEFIPTRSDKFKGLYKQVYNAYDEFENLIIPSNAKEIDIKDLQKEIANRDDYQKVKEYNNIINTNNQIIRKEQIKEQQRKENEIYDIKELLNKALEEKKKPELIGPTLSNENYLKKLKMDNYDATKTNIEQVKEMYKEIAKDSKEDDEDSLLKTANLSLEILSDLKGDNEETIVNIPMKPKLQEKNINIDKDFFSNTYKFNKKDFDNKKDDDNQPQKEEDDDDDCYDKTSNKYFFKILLLVFGISLVVIIAIYLFNYFNRV